MLYILPAPDSEVDYRDAYVIELLTQCLERTKDKYGEFTLVRTALTMSMLRRVKTLENATNEITVTTFPDQKSFNDKLLPVQIPIDFGLAGYRVFLIKEDNQERFYNIRNLSDLRHISIGVGRSWVDGLIIRDAGIKVVTGNSYDGLFKMLSEGRFDGLNRSVRDVMVEYEAYHSAFANLTVEKGLLLHYALPDYFWFSNTPGGQRLATRVKEGLVAVKADGTMQAIFKEKFCTTIASLHLDRRTLIEIPNKMLEEKGLDSEVSLNEMIRWCK